MARRLFKRLLPARGKGTTAQWPWVIISNDPSNVSQRTSIGDFLTEIPATGHYNVLIDDGCHNYSQLVDYIKAHSDDKRLAFHIFADRHGIIISPKMS